MMQIIEELIEEIEIEKRIAFSKLEYAFNEKMDIKELQQLSKYHSKLCIEYQTLTSIILQDKVRRKMNDYASWNDNTNKYTIHDKSI